jgi:hypothetical protein
MFSSILGRPRVEIHPAPLRSVVDLLPAVDDSVGIAPSWVSEDDLAHYSPAST